ncbi:hypothetical protein C8J57DRAFT_336291 [Mycena rebaudengoi]|nr:hypothetical protein C8J57DRAFT_336291 [Mycena rebaudengoi]
MQFSLIAVCAAVTAVALGAPAPSFMKRASCHMTACVAELAPSITACATAASKKGRDPLADGDCLVEAAKVIDDFPSACRGCVDDLGSDVEDGLSSIVGKIGSIF